jgi:thiol:disulfide interchange protein
MRRALLLLLLCACTPSSGANEPDETPIETSPWTVVTGRAGLDTALAKAGTRGLVLDVKATWCVPCRALEQETFGDKRVVAALADHAWIALDVSDGTDPQLALQTFLGAETLPHVLRYDDASMLLAALQNGAARAPKPALEVRMFVTADELLGALSK